MRRSYEPELLDRDDIPADDIRRNMHELNIINSYLGGHAITLKGFRKLSQLVNNQKGECVVCEIGCGGGDNLYVIWKWCRQNNIRVKLIGIDINPYCIAVARERLGASEADLITADFRRVNFEKGKPDIIFSSLFCHHFVETELIDMLKWMHKHSGSGFFINDLHRHPLAYHSISILTRMFSSSYLVKHDAPLSVLRGFTSAEWKELLEAASLPNHSVEWKWAFRHLITVLAKSQ